MALSYYDQYSKDPSLTMDAYGTFYRPDGTAVSQSAENSQAAEMQRLQEANNRISRLNSIDGGNRDQLSGFNYDDNAYFAGAQNFTPSSAPTGTTYNNTKPLSAGGGFSFGGGSAGGGGGGMSSGGGYGAQNPYLQQMGDALTKTMTNNWQRNVQPQIASSAMAAGGYGGSRQGVIEANSANDLNQGIGSALAGLYGNGYNTSLQYDLGVKNNQLGFGNLGLGYANLDRTINNDNNNWQLQGANFGLGVYNQMQQNNQAGIQSGTNIQNTPMNYWSQFGNQANSFGQGYGTTTGSTSQQGSPFMGALGGAQLGSKIGNWWGGGTAGSAGDTATGQNFWAPNFSGGMGD